MTKDEAMKMALEALECHVLGFDQVRKMELAIEALEQALEQPEQEPVVWMYQDKSTHEVRFQKHMRGFVDHGTTYETPLYTVPPKREWVGLTEQEIEKLSDKHLVSVQEYIGSGDYVSHFEGETDFARAIEAKLKEKNRG